MNAAVSPLPGAIGHVAADDTGRQALRRDTNLQYGAVACRAADMFLSASDGLWDTLDAVQNGRPRQFGLHFDKWDDLGMRDTQRIVKLVRFPPPLPCSLPPFQPSILMQSNSGSAASVSSRQARRIESSTPGASSTLTPTMQYPTSLPPCTMGRMRCATQRVLLIVPGAAAGTTLWTQR